MIDARTTDASPNSRNLSIGSSRQVRFMDLRALAVPLLCAAALLVGGLRLATPAHAEESVSASGSATDAEEVRDVGKRLRQHLREQDGDAIKADLEKIAEAYTSVDEKAARKRMLDAVGKAARYRNEDIQSAALDAFEEMKDPDAWKYYRFLLGSPFEDSLPRLSSQAMDVTRALTPDAAVAPLLKILKKSKSLAAAAKALDTLGAFRKSRQRTRILAEIIAVTQKEKPGVRGRDNTVVYGPRQSGDQARNRWQALAHPMVEAANELTGRDLDSPEAWFATWRENKRNPSDLFGS
jgi:hypothetical protein